MSIGEFPLLFFPRRTGLSRSSLPAAPPRIQAPSINRQGERLAPQFSVLQDALEARRLRLLEDSPPSNPELVLVLEVLGSTKKFARAVKRIQGLDWLLELVAEHIEPDEDFFDLKSPEKEMTGRLYLLGSNKEALDQLVSLWRRYKKNTKVKFERKLNSLKDVFKYLKSIRYWDVRDRIGSDVIEFWKDEVEFAKDSITFEIDAWYYDSFSKNRESAALIESLVERLGGRVLSSACLMEIRYHGLLVELPVEAVRSILDGKENALVLSDRVMHFRARTQSLATSDLHLDESEVGIPPTRRLGPPVVALLDGLPLENHPLLRDRLYVDDPDGWSSTYEAKDRVHGTTMASLILHGDLGAGEPPMGRQLYVRPILRTDLGDWRERREEKTPGDSLLVDLIHRAVKRICQGDGTEEPAAATVRVINLSVGDRYRVFSHEMSPWARLLDWLSSRYDVLFVVSAGNDVEPLHINTPNAQFAAATQEDRAKSALRALMDRSDVKRIMSPSESVNALTVGAIHSDASDLKLTPDTYDLFSEGGVSPVSRVGHGYHRSVKPDLLAPGGRCVYKSSLIGSSETTSLSLVWGSRAPGQRVALPPLTGVATLQNTGFSRGTSNAAAITSRAAARIYDVIEELRDAYPKAPPPQYDAVLLKALLVHGCTWGSLGEQILAVRQDLNAIADTGRRNRAIRDHFSRWLGYGSLNVERSVACARNRATLIGVGELHPGSAYEFSAPLPPSLSATTEWRRMVVTLAWITPINYAHQSYRGARLWITGVGDELSVERHGTVEFQTSRRGTVEHQVFESRDAVAFSDGSTFKCKVNCEEEAGKLLQPVKFCLCVSLEVELESSIDVYQEIRSRIETRVQVSG